MFLDFYQNPDAWMAKSSMLFKNDRASTVCRVFIADQDFVIKRHNIRGPWHAVKKAYCTSRAMRSWRIAKILQHHDIPCVAPVAMMEQRWGPFQLRSYFVSQYLEGEDAILYFKYAEPKSQAWGPIAKAVVKLIRQLDRAGFIHRDLNLSNMRMHQGVAVLLDLDGIQFVPPRARNAETRYQNQRRFLKNWEQPQYVAPEAHALFEGYFLSDPP